MEKRIVSGVALSGDEARITLFGMPDRTDAQAQVFARLASARINVDMIAQSRARAEARSNLTFTLGKRDAARAVELMGQGQAEIGFSDISSDDGVAKVSVVGVGMRSHAGVAETMFRALANADIALHAISTSEIKISVLVDAARGEDAVRALHAAFGLNHA